MIFINVQFHVKPEYADTFLDEMDWFTQACRAEEGNLDFKWFRDPEDDQRFLLLETPDIINFHIGGKTEWDKMAEFGVEH